MSTVSVIIPCYNYGHFVTGCVKSVLANEVVDLDILVIDDCSPDGSWEVVKRLPELDPRIRVTRNEVNRGVVANINEGLAAAKGDYAVLLSADDALAPGWLDRAAAHLDAHPGAVLAYGPRIRFRGAVPADAPKPVKATVHNGHDWLVVRCDNGLGLLASPEVVVRTRAQHEVGLYTPDNQWSGDMEMWMRLASIGDVISIMGSAAAYYRISATSMYHSAKTRYISDLRWSVTAFEAWHAFAEGRVADRDDLLARADRAVARHALMRAKLAALVDPEQVEELCAFALERDPGSAEQVERIRRRQASRGLGVALRMARPGLRVALRATTGVRQFLGDVRTGRQRGMLWLSRLASRSRA